MVMANIWFVADIVVPLLHDENGLFLSCRSKLYNNVLKLGQSICDQTVRSHTATKNRKWYCKSDSIGMITLDVLQACDA